MQGKNRSVNMKITEIKRSCIVMVLVSQWLVQVEGAINNTTSSVFFTSNFSSMVSQSMNLSSTTVSSSAAIAMRNASRAELGSTVLLNGLPSSKLLSVTRTEASPSPSTVTTQHVNIIPTSPISSSSKQNSTIKSSSYAVQDTSAGLSTEKPSTSSATLSIADYQTSVAYGTSIYSTTPMAKIGTSSIILKDMVDSTALLTSSRPATTSVFSETRTSALNSLENTASASSIFYTTELTAEGPMTVNTTHMAWKDDKQTSTYSINAESTSQTTTILTSMMNENSDSPRTSYATQTPLSKSESSSLEAQHSPSQMHHASSGSITATLFASTSFTALSSAVIITTQSPFIRDEFLIFRLTSLLTNKTFSQSLANRTTKEYSNLATLVKHELQTILNQSGHYENVVIVSFSNSSNSVQIVADIYYNFTTSITDGILKRNIETKSSSFSAVSIKELCSNVSCSNRGTCKETGTNITCSCTIGFSGARCLTSYPVDGNYTEWSSYQRCSKSCGEGVQIRTRTCTNPPAMHGGKDCSHLGVASESKPCNEYKCDEIDWVIWVIVGAAAFILLMVIILACCFRRRKKYYYQDYGLTQDGRSYSLTRALQVNKTYKENLAEFRSHENVVPLEILKDDPFKNGYTNQQFEPDEPNHNGDSVYERELKTFLGNTDKIRAKEQADSGEYLEPEQTFHSPKRPKDAAKTQVVYENTPERML